jgi:hypothetical protein
MDTTIATQITYALQGAFEALNELALDLPPARKAKIEANTARIFRAKVALATWVDENR